MSANSKVTLSQVLPIVILLAFTLFLTLAFQMTQILRDRDALHQAKTQQEKPLEDVQKLQAQLSALALGTKKLADGGDKNAQAIIAQLKQAGIVVGAPPPATGGSLSAKPMPGAPPAAAPGGKEGSTLPVAPQPASEQP